MSRWPIKSQTPGLEFKAFQDAVPRLPVGADEHSGRFVVAADGFFFGIPLQFAAGAEGDVCKMAGGGDTVAVFDVGDGALAGLDAIEEVADVEIELLGTRAFFLHGLDPWFGLRSRGAGASAGLALEAGDG